MGLKGFFVKIGKGGLKAIKVANKVTSHPLFVPVTMMIPIKQAQLALTVVQRVNGIAADLRDEHGEEMSDADRKAAFVADLRKEYPDASDSELDMLAAAFANIEKGKVEEEED